MHPQSKKSRTATYRSSYCCFVVVDILPGCLGGTVHLLGLPIHWSHGRRGRARGSLALFLHRSRFWALEVLGTRWRHEAKEPPLDPPALREVRGMVCAFRVLSSRKYRAVKSAFPRTRPLHEGVYVGGSVMARMTSRDAACLRRVDEPSRWWTVYLRGQTSKGLPTWVSVSWKGK